jgi:hypothetical protein
MTARCVYVDETKRAGYVMAAVTVREPEKARKAVRDLVLPGQRRLHMKNEQPKRRRTIVSAILGMQVVGTIYDAARRYPTEQAARAACFEALVEDLAAPSGRTELVIEQDESLVRTDRQQLYQLVRKAGVADALGYRHQRAYEEPLLALPDAVAWCWARSGDWRRRIGPILTGGVRHVGL